jgi:hypothetical protein
VAILYSVQPLNDVTNQQTTVDPATYDAQRFRVEQRRLFGPFYSVKVIDMIEDRPVPLWRGGSFLAGKSSVRRAVKYGIERYLRERSR